MNLTLKEKVAYGLGAVGKDMVYMLSASYVLYYFQDVLGVSAVAMGIILLVARIFDAFNDPIMGIIVAKTNTKWGKFRPWLFIGTVTNAVILFLMFAAPPKLDGPGLVAYAAVTYILWGITYTMMDIPYWSMIPAFTKGGKEREGLTTLARSCAGVGSAIITIAAILIVHAIGGRSIDLGATQKALDVVGASIEVSEDKLDDHILIVNGTGNKKVAENWSNTLASYGYTTVDVYDYESKSAQEQTMIFETGDYTFDDREMSEVENESVIAKFFPGAAVFFYNANADYDGMDGITMVDESKIMPEDVNIADYDTVILAGTGKPTAVESIGFKYLALIVAILFVIFITITCIAIKEKSTVDMESPSVGKMFKALVQNDQAMTVVIAIVLINCAVYITSNLVIYFFKYDFGGSGWAGSYTLFNMFGGAIQILSMMVAYPLLRKKFTNLKIFYICLGSAIIGYISLLLIAFINMSVVYILFIPGFFIFAANGVLQVLTTVFLANTVDYGELKNGRRDESVIFSMQTFVVKLASGIAAFVASLSLAAFNLSEGDTPVLQQNIDLSAGVSQASKMGLRMVMTVLPIIGLIIAIFWFKKRFILTDEKMEEITAEVQSGKAGAGE